jgi:hypothetical protein
MRKIIAWVCVLSFSMGAAQCVGAEADSYARCPKYEAELAKYPAWSVSRMSYIMWRESRCIPTIVNKTGRDTGLLQIHPVTWPWLSGKFGVPVYRMQAWLKTPANNVKAGYALCRFWQRAGKGCYQPWAVR